MNDKTTQTQKMTNASIINAMHEEHLAQIDDITKEFYHTGWIIRLCPDNAHLHVKLWDYARHYSNPLYFIVSKTENSAKLTENGDYGPDGEFGEGGAVLSRITKQLNDWLKKEIG